MNYKRKFVSRLGLMHMLANNLCIWIKARNKDDFKLFVGGRDGDGA